MEFLQVVDDVEEDGGDVDWIEKLRSVCVLQDVAACFNNESNSRWVELVEKIKMVDQVLSSLLKNRVQIVQRLQRSCDPCCVLVENEDLQHFQRFLREIDAVVVAAAAAAAAAAATPTHSLATPLEQVDESVLQQQLVELEKWKTNIQLGLQYLEQVNQNLSQKSPPKNGQEPRNETIWRVRDLAI